MPVLLVAGSLAIGADGAVSIEHEGVALGVCTRLLRTDEMPFFQLPVAGTRVECTGELEAQPEGRSGCSSGVHGVPLLPSPPQQLPLVIRARVFRVVEGIDMALLEQALQARRAFLKE